MIAALMLFVIWGSTYFLVNKERADIERQVAMSVVEVTDTYEARVVRALREIDTALKLVRFAANSSDQGSVLDILDAQRLLPPSLLFTVSIVDAQGVVTESTVPVHIGQLVKIPTQAEEAVDYLEVSEGYADKSRQLTFTRPLMTERQGAEGWVVIAIDADYFVSGYEVRSLGQQGLLALVGDNGIARVRRTGNSIYSGEFMDITTWERGAPDMVQTPFLVSWQGIERYTLVRQLFDFPLSIVVGLSTNEQLAVALQLSRNYWRRAGWTSGVLLIILAVLGRLSWHLQRARQRVMNERVLHAQQVEHLAFHDTLTDLPNRALLSHLVTQAVTFDSRHGDSFALLFLDLDRFKLINDSLGHDAGDHLLRVVAKRLILAVRESDVVARLGGDEFVILLRKVLSRDQIDPIAKKILASVREPFMLAGQACHISVSIGVSVFPFDGLDEQTLMKRADMAMYQAKQVGKNNVQFYTAELSAEMDARLTLESGLHQALARHEFTLFYQSKHDAEVANLIGMEAILRWQHPTLGLLEPAYFMTLAEESGLVIPVGQWVLENACRQSMAWQRLGLPRVTMAVNISARQFYDDSFVESVRSALTLTGMEPALLELEVAEHIVLQDVRRTATIFAKIKELGVKVVVDDFGHGYSSLAALKCLPVDALKIDSSLIISLSGTRFDQQLSLSMIELGRRLSLQVFAKGVDTQEQACLINSHATLPFEGVYSNKPLPAEECYEEGKHLK